MDLMIITKWLTDFSGREHEAPSVITTMINIALGGGYVPETDAPFFGTRSFQ